MFKQVAFLVGFCACLSTPAMSADGTYLGLNAGITMPSDSDVSDSIGNGRISFDSGIAFSATAGQKIGIGRLEAELGYKKADIKKIYADGLGSAKVNGDISVLSLMGNGFIDFGANQTVKPYIMAGLGGAKLKLKSTDMDADEDDNVFAYQAGLGCGISLSEIVIFDVSYRYMGTSDADFDGTKVSYGSHNLLAGIRFNF